MTISAQASEALLFDEADLLTSGEERALGGLLEEISSEHDAQVVIATIPYLESGSVDMYIEYIYDAMDFGYGPDRDGVLLLVCMNPREYRILSNGYAADAIHMTAIDTIGSRMVSDLSGGAYFDAFKLFAEDCAYYLNGYRNGFPFDFRGALTLALIIGLLAGLITALVLKSQLKSIRRQNRAHDYIRSGSMQLTTQRDLFLYRQVTRTRKEPPKSSSSGSGGRSRNVGGGSF